MTRTRTASTHAPASPAATLVLALALVLTVVAPSAMPGTPGASAAVAEVHSPTPAPASVVATGPIDIAAWLRSPAPVTEVEVTVDGAALSTATTGAPDAELGTPVLAPVTLAAGEHTVAVRFTDEDGNHAERAWNIVTADVALDRLAGTDRFATAVAISRASHPDDRSADGAVLARGDGFADALAGAPLASTVASGPLLLARRDGLPDATAEELRRVLSPGATVHLLGGTAALDETVEQAIRDLDLTPVRHEGADRYATAAEVARALPLSTHAFVASGLQYPDALAASVPAARDGSPILLTAPDHLPDVTADALRRRGVESVTIVGGEAAVSEDVARALAEVVSTIDRVSGPDRYATAVAIAARFAGDSGTVAMAAGDGFADALAGAPHLARLDAPLLLTPRTGLAPATTDAVRALRPGAALLLGGTAVLPPVIARDVMAATVDPAGAPRVTGMAPAPTSLVGFLGRLRLAVDEDLDLARSHAYVTIGGVEVPVELATEGSRILLIMLPNARAVTPEVLHEVEVAVAVADADGDGLLRRSWSLLHVRPDPHLADAGPVALFRPSDDVELVGFHQSNHDGAQQITPRDTATRTITLEDRERGTGSRTAADIVANPDLPVYAPATGTVIRAGSYRLYCDHTDHYLVIEPDAAPGWEVKMLHFRDLAVSTGQRVTGGVTRVGSGPRALPFESQVDEESGPANWPHVHVEVVDPSIPDRPGAGC